MKVCPSSIRRFATSQSGLSAAETALLACVLGALCVTVGLQLARGGAIASERVDDEIGAGSPTRRAPREVLDWKIATSDLQSTGDLQEERWSGQESRRERPGRDQAPPGVQAGEAAAGAIAAIGDFLHGTIAQWTYDNGWWVPGALRDPWAPRDGEPGAMIVGRLTGGAIAILQAVWELDAGGGMMAGGGALVFSGVGAAAAPAAIAAGAAIFAHGATTGISAAKEEGELLGALFKKKHREAPGGPSGGGSGARQPWRGRPEIKDGSLDEGWTHIEARHVTGRHPQGAGDLFARGTTRRQLEEAARKVIEKGTRVSDPARRLQIFEKHLSVNGRPDRVRVVVDTADGRVITMFPVRGGGH